MTRYFKGGRGKKAPYETTMIRIPLPLKPLVLKLAEEYRLQAEVASTVGMAKELVERMIEANWSKEKIEEVVKKLFSGGSGDATSE